MRYKTKVDVWLYPALATLFLLPPILIGLGVIGCVCNREEPLQGVILIVLGCVLLALAFGLAWPVDYTLGEQELTVRFGVAKIRIPYAAITEVRPTHNPLSSPAWSLDRLRIEYSGRAILISPQERDRFLEDLAQRDGALHREGDRLIRG